MEERKEDGGTLKPNSKNTMYTKAERTCSCLPPALKGLAQKQEKMQRFKGSCRERKGQSPKCFAKEPKKRSAAC